MTDKILHGMSADGGIRIYAANTTNLVREAQRIHNTYPIPTAALGRLLTAAAMMGSMLKSESDSLTLQIRGDGPLGGILAVGNSKAEVKGYVINPDVVLPDKIPGKLNVGDAVGAGTLGVIRDMGLKEPYAGQIQLVSGEIAEDITAYYAESEQIPAAVALGVLVDTDGSVITAGGFILQLMPGVTDEEAAQLEKTIASIPPITTMLSEGMSCEDIIFSVTEGFDLLVYHGETVTPKYECDCSRERVERALISMGSKELSDLIAEQGRAELTCQFCDVVYEFTSNDLQNLLIECGSKNEKSQKTEIID